MKYLSWPAHLHIQDRTRILWFDVVLRHGPAPRVYRAPDWRNVAQGDVV